MGWPLVFGTPRLLPKHPTDDIKGAAYMAGRCQGFEEGKQAAIDIIREKIPASTTMAMPPKLKVTPEAALAIQLLIRQVRMK